MAEVTIYVRFNPTLVRLRLCPWAGVVPQRCRFNPTLVRLRLLVLDEGGLWLRCFNPTLVRLRPVPVCHSGGRVRGFNPTLVRLRLVSMSVHGLSWFMFQSHAGSIEAGIDVSPRVELVYVSIPRWFD